MTEKKSIDMILYEFENQYSDFLLNLKTKDGYLLWQIVKRPLFYKLIHSNKSNNNFNQNETAIKKFNYLISSFIKVLKTVIFNRGKTLIITTDFRRKELEKEMIEPLTDSMIESLHLKNFVLGIQRRWLFKNDPQNLRNKIDFDFNILYFSKRFIGIFYKEIYRFEIIDLSNKLEEFFEREKLIIPINLHDSITGIVKNHYIEKDIFSLFMRFFKPKQIYAVDSLATGMHHAAKNLKIDFFEIQHGFISDYKVDYIIHPKLKADRTALLLPKNIFLFGDFYKNILLKRSVWNSSEIKTFHKIDNLKRDEPITNHPQIFFYPHQWVFFEETIEIIKAFSRSEKKLKIKFHPNESSDNLVKLQNLCIEHNNIEVVPITSSIAEITIDVDAVFGFFTTVLLETAAMNVPTLTLKKNSDLRKTSMHEYVSDEQLKDHIIERNMDLFLNEIQSNKEILISKELASSNYLQV